MKTKFLFLILAFSTSLLTGCDDGFNLQNYVSQSISLTSSSTEPVATGGVSFYKRVTFTENERVCDKQACGSDRQQVCHFVNMCHMEPRPPVCMIVHGVRRCQPSSPHEVCSYQNQCRLESVTRYCDVNCRVEPVWRATTETTISPLRVEIAGASTAADLKFTLGLHTTSAFAQAYQDPSTRPWGTGDLFDDLQAKDQSILGLQSTQYKLEGPKDFLSLPDGFKPGDPILIKVQVNRVRAQEDGESSDPMISVLGSETNLPGPDL